jgi:hypothetical protein
VTPGDLAGGFWLPGAAAPPDRTEETFGQRLTPLPPATRLLLLVAAAEPIHDPVLVWRAAGQLGIKAEAAAAAAAAGLIESGGQIRFRHPLARSAVYRTASPDERRRVHLALAEAIDPDAEPDRRAWHRAHATPALDEGVAAELERSAERAQARGGAGRPDERRRGIAALGQHAVGGLDRLPVRLPGRVLAGPRERADDQPLVAVSPASTTPPSSPGWPFSVQIVPVIEAAARNCSICSRRRAPPCPSMSSGHTSTWLKNLDLVHVGDRRHRNLTFHVHGRCSSGFLWFASLPASSLGGPIAPVNSLACILIGNRALSRAADSRLGFSAVG